MNVDRDQRLLLPPDMREWIPKDDLVHFVIEAVEKMDLRSFKLNTRGTGSPQYPPHMMLSLLIYCYANGIFSSRRIERATHRDIAVRYLTGDTHPDHDTICAFRREKLEQARARIEARTKAKAEEERVDYKRKCQAREERRGLSKGPFINEPDPTPEPKTQDNLTDPDSRIMRKNKRSSYEQAYSAQAVVDADGSQLVLVARVSQCSVDRIELVPDTEAIPESIGCPRPFWPTTDSLMKTAFAG